MAALALADHRSCESLGGTAIRAQGRAGSFASEGLMLRIGCVWGKTVLAGPVQLHAVGCFQLSTTRRTNTGGLEDFKSHFAHGRAYRFLRLFSKRS